MNIFLLLVQKCKSWDFWLTAFPRFYLFVPSSEPSRCAHEVDLTLDWPAGSRPPCFDGFSSLNAKQLDTTASSSGNSNQFIFFPRVFSLRKMTKRWLSGVVCLWGVSSAAHLSEAKTSVFFLHVRILFVLARCTETICHYVSKCKTRASCIVI